MSSLPDAPLDPYLLYNGLGLEDRECNRSAGADRLRLGSERDGSFDAISVDILIFLLTLKESVPALQLYTMATEPSASFVSAGSCHIYS